MNTNCIWPQLLPPNLEPDFADKVPHKFITLENGLRVIIGHDPNDRSTFMQMFVNAGGLQQTPANRGLAHFVEHLVHQKTLYWNNMTELKKFQLKYNIDSNAYTSEAEQCFYTTSDNDLESLEAAIRILHGTTLGSLVEEKLVEPERQIILSECNEDKSDFDQTAYRELNNYLLGSDHALGGGGVLGKSEDVEKLKFEDMLAFKEKYFTPANMLLCIAGGATIQEYEELMRKYFDKPAKDKNWISNKYIDWKRTIPSEKTTRIKLDFEKAEVAKIFYHPFEKFSSGKPERIAMQMAKMIVGQRFFQRLRTEKNLTYAAGAQWTRANADDVQILYGAFKPDNFEKGNAEMDSFVQDMPNLKISEDEFIGAKKSVTSTRWARSLRDVLNSAATHYFQRGQLLSPEWNHYLMTDVTLDMVQRVMLEVYDPEIMETVYVGKV